MILPENIIAYLRDLFFGVGFSEKEINDQIIALEKSFRILFTCRILEKIPQEKQKHAGEQMEKTKNTQELIAFLQNFFKDNIGEEEVKKIYDEELRKILEPIFKPLKEECTPEHLAEIAQLSQKYFG